MSTQTTSFQRGLNLLTNPRFVSLAVVIAAGVLLIAFLGEPLLPFFIGLVIAYFLDGGVRYVMRWKDSRALAVAVVFATFLLCYVLALIGPLQLAARQTVQLGRNAPAILEQLQRLALAASQHLEEIVPMERQEHMRQLLAEKVRGMGELLLGKTLASIPEATTWAIYLVLIPLIVFFLLKDKQSLQRAMLRLLPQDRELVDKVWWEVEGKIANYVRGKVWEILIVGTVTAVVFAMLGFRYPAVVGLISGISVVIPFVGAFAVAVPVFILGYVQWGWGSDLGWLLLAYVTIQVVDGNILVPLIFSEAVKLHPLAILLGVVIFGSLWGFWGVFFAIPLATLGKSLLEVILELRAQQRSGGET
jgi:putative permease